MGEAKRRQQSGNNSIMSLNDVIVPIIGVIDGNIAVDVMCAGFDMDLSENFPRRMVTACKIKNTMSAMKAGVQPPLYQIIYIVRLEKNQKFSKTQPYTMDRHELGNYEPTSSDENFVKDVLLSALWDSDLEEVLKKAVRSGKYFQSDSNLNDWTPITGFLTGFKSL